MKHLKIDLSDTEHAALKLAAKLAKLSMKDVIKYSLLAFFSHKVLPIERGARLDGMLMRWATEKQSLLDAETNIISNRLDSINAKLKTPLTSAAIASPSIVAPKSSPASSPRDLRVRTDLAPEEIEMKELLEKVEDGRLTPEQFNRELLALSHKVNTPAPSEPVTPIADYPSIPHSLPGSHHIPRAEIDQDPDDFDLNAPLSPEKQKEWDTYRMSLPVPKKLSDL